MHGEHGRGGNYCRIGNEIANYDDMDKDGRPAVITFTSINDAKKASRLIQLKKEGAIGRGSLYKVKKTW